MKRRGGFHKESDGVHSTHCAQHTLCTAHTVHSTHCAHNLTKAGLLFVRKVCNKYSVVIFLLLQYASTDYLAVKRKPL